MLCKLKTCPVSVLFRSFYDTTLATSYVKDGHGVGFIPFFSLALLSALFYGIFSLFLLGNLSPEMISERIVDFPTIEIKNGEIVEPKNFFQRFTIGDDFHIVLDTSSDTENLKPPTAHELYISKNGVQFVKGHKVELMSLSKFLGSKNVTITAESISEFIVKKTSEMMVTGAFFVFLFAIPVLFLKYVICAYIVSIFSYILTLITKRKLPFESRMRLATVSVLPVFVFNFFFGTILGLFYLHYAIAVIVIFIYIVFYLMHLKDVALDNQTIES